MTSIVSDMNLRQWRLISIACIRTPLQFRIPASLRTCFNLTNLTHVFVKLKTPAPNPPLIKMMDGGMEDILPLFQICSRLERCLLANTWGRGVGEGLALTVRPGERRRRRRRWWEMFMIKAGTRATQPLETL